MSTWFEVTGAAIGRRTEPAAVTIGMFDGVHRGHQHVLARARQVSSGLETVAVTFEPHPMAVVRPDRTPLRLTSLERRVELLHEHGADEVRVLDFTPEMASWGPEDFIDRIIVDELRARRVVVGENFRFGARAAGDPELLRTRCSTHGCDAESVQLVGEGEFSSSRVRTLVGEGLLPEAADVLGRPHEVSGVVTRGDQRGRDLGFPTANVPVDPRYAVPPDGVYAGWLVADTVRYPAAVSVGSNPTFDGTERRVESYVIDHGHDLALYDLPVRVELLERIRPMETFDTVDALVAQMHDDVTASREVLQIH